MSSSDNCKINYSKIRVTERQKTAFDLYDIHGSYQRVAEIMGINAANVQKHRISYIRNLAMLDGIEVPKINDLLKKGATVKFIKRLRQEPLENVTLKALVYNDDIYIDDVLDDDEIEAKHVFATGKKIVKRTIISIPKKGISSFLLTGSQDATPVHENGWHNMMTYQKWLKERGECKVISAPLLYNKGIFGDQGNQERHFLSPKEMHKMSDSEIKKTVFFDDALDGFIEDHCIEIDGKLDFCAHMNTSPTAVTPLSGLQTHTGPRWGVFPHTKQHMESIARIPGEPYKANITTGCITLPNYIKKKAGMKAEHHHTLGFVIVEVLPDGRFWVRNVEIDEETGDFYDLDRKVSNGVVTEGHSVASISYGDVHHEKLDPEVAKNTWGYDVKKGILNKRWNKKSLVNILNPKHQFFHDVCDFAPRNHHNIKDPHFHALAKRNNEESVKDALEGVARFLRCTQRKNCLSVVVQSNHDNAYSKWLKEGSVKLDPANAEIFHWANYQIYRHIRKHGTEPFIFEMTIRHFCKDLDFVKFIDENTPFKVYGVEHSQHGHLGANGARGGIGLYKVSVKITIGHTHSPAIRDGLFIGGVCNMDMLYNKGATSWAIAHVVGHDNGARQIVFMQGDRFAA